MEKYILPSYHLFEQFLTFPYVHLYQISPYIVTHNKKNYFLRFHISRRGGANDEFGGISGRHVCSAPPVPGFGRCYPCFVSSPRQVYRGRRHLGTPPVRSTLVIKASSPSFARLTSLRSSAAHCSLSPSLGRSSLPWTPRRR